LPPILASIPPRLVGLPLVVLWALAAGPLLAQSPSPGLGADGSVGARVGGSLGMGTLKKEVSVQAGARGGIDLLPWLRAGGEATLILNRPRVSPEGAATRTELGLGYGGIFLEVNRRALDGADPWAAAVLLGAGTARVRSPSLGSELDARTFFLLEPSLARQASLPGPLSVEGRLAYRVPLNAQPLVGVHPSDLRGVSIRLSLFLVRSP
jgi:hypothetical protein